MLSGTPSFLFVPDAKPFLYTDGVPEATNNAGRMFGLERMLDGLNADAAANPEDVLSHVRHAVDDFVAGAEQFDDLTMLCVEYKGANGARSGCFVLNRQS